VLSISAILLSTKHVKNTLSVKYYLSSRVNYSRFKRKRKLIFSAETKENCSFHRFIIYIVILGRFVKQNFLLGFSKWASFVVEVIPTNFSERFPSFMVARYQNRMKLENKMKRFAVRRYCEV